MNSLQWMMLVHTLVDLCLGGVCLAIWREERSRHLLYWTYGWLGLAAAHGCSLANTWWPENVIVYTILVVGNLVCLSGWTIGINRFLGRTTPKWIPIPGCLCLAWNIAFSIAPEYHPFHSAPLFWFFSALFAWLGWLLVRSFPNARGTALITAMPFWIMTLLSLIIPWLVTDEGRLPGTDFYASSTVASVILGLGLLLLHHHRKHDALLNAIEAISTERERATRLIAESPIGIVVLDDERVVASFNQAASSISGLSAENVIGRPFSHLAELLGKELAKAAQTNRSDDPPARVTLTTSDADSHVHVLVNTWPLGVDGEEVITLQDITVETHLSEALEHQQRLEAIGQLAGGVAHDFNNLLVGILGHAELLRMRPIDPSQLDDVVQIQKSAERASQLTQKLLAFSRKQVLQPKLVDLSAVVDDISRLLQRIIGETVELITSLEDEPVLAEVDPVQLEQVVVNLATNAKLAMPKGGRLKIRTAIWTMEPGSDTTDLPPGRYACLLVEDNGTGIPPEILDRIFEPFFTTRAVGKGTGLGLSTVHGIVRQSGGDIIVNSKVGEGTTFNVLFPESSGAPDPIEQPSAASGPRGKGRVLVVEDETIVVRIVVSTLERSGYEVIQAANGMAALELVEEHGDAPLDLLVSDVVMPQLDGPGLAEKLRETYPHLPVLFISGYSATTQIQLDERTRFLSKPFKTAKLLEEVSELLVEETEDP